MFDYEKINISMTKQELISLIREEVQQVINQVGENLLARLEEEITPINTDYGADQLTINDIDFMVEEKGDVLLDTQLKSVYMLIETFIENTSFDNVSPDNIISILESEALKQ